MAEYTNSKFLKLVSENPELPIIPMVDNELCGDDYGRYMGTFGYAYVGEYALFNERVYDDREDFEEDYYEAFCDELCEKFNYNPNDVNSDDKPLNDYLHTVSDDYFKKAILVNIDLPVV